MPNKIVLKLEEEISTIGQRVSLGYIKSLLEPLNDEMKQKVLLANGSKAFYTAVKLNKYRVVNYLLDIANVNTRQHLLADNQLLITVIESARSHLRPDYFFQIHFPILDAEPRSVLSYMKSDGTSKYLNCFNLIFQSSP